MTALALAAEPADATQLTRAQLQVTIPFSHVPGPQRVRIAYELNGPESAPVVIALGGISAGRHVGAHADAPEPGWWEGFVGPGCALDTGRWRVLAIDWLFDEPQRGCGITTQDQAEALRAVLDALGIECVHGIAGASYGGMVALAFAARWPHRVRQLLVISAAHRAHPFATSQRAIQRQIIELGERAGDAASGVALARALAVTTYRTAEEFGDRFDGVPQRVGSRWRAPVEAYLEHQGERHAARCPAARYRVLSESLDLHAVDPASIRTPLEIVGVVEDRLVPYADLQVLAARVRAAVRLTRLRSRYGHDAFLKEHAAIGAALCRLTESEI